MVQLSCAKLAKLYESNPRKAKKLIETCNIYQETTKRHVLWGRVVKRNKTFYNALISTFYSIGPDHRRIAVEIRLQKEGERDRFLDNKDAIQEAINLGFKVVGIRLQDILDSYHIRLPEPLLRALAKRIWKNLLEDIKELKSIADFEQYCEK